MHAHRHNTHARSRAIRSNAQKQHAVNVTKEQTYCCIHCGWAILCIKQTRIKQNDNIRLMVKHVMRQAILNIKQKKELRTGCMNDQNTRTGLGSYRGKRAVL